MARSQAAALVLATALLLGLLALWTTAAARGATSPDGDVVMLLAKGAGEVRAEQVADTVDGNVVAAIPQLGAYLVDLPSETKAAQNAAAATLDDAPLVRDAGPARTFRLADDSPLALFDDPLLGSQWHLATIHAGEAWTRTLGDPGVVIAVVDTGVDYNHPDLAGRVLLGPDLADGDADPMDVYGHGTHVAGIAAATADNALGGAGVCPGCTVMAVKVFSDGSGSTSDFLVAQGIVWAVDHGADVVNLSLGGPGSSAVSQSAVDYAWNHGVVVVAAAGNGGNSTPSYPAAYPNSIAVSATTPLDTLASFSTFGSWVDVSAPGTSILSTVPGNGYASWSGTSMATPVVAGAAGLAFSQPGSDAAAVRAELEAGVVDLGAPGRDDSFGYGRIDLARVLATPSPVTVATSSLPAGKVGVSYGQTLAATDGTPPYAWSITSDSLPLGLTLDAATGAITGVPAAAGTFPVTVAVADSAGGSATAQLTLSVAPAVSLDLSGGWSGVGSSLRRGVWTASGTFVVRAAGGNVTKTFTLRLSIVDATGRSLSSRLLSLRNVTPSRPYRASFSYSSRSGVSGLTLRADVDASAQIAEADESNNTATALVP